MRGPAFRVRARGVAGRHVAESCDHFGEDGRRSGVVQVYAGQGVCWWMSSLRVPW
jgi:hypothetical protein